MTCLVCKNGEMKDTIHSYITEVNGCYVIIENVPCKKCDQCGELFFSIDVLERIDEILEMVGNISSRLLIMDYSKAA